VEQQRSRTSWVKQWEVLTSRLLSWIAYINGVYPPICPFSCESKSAPCSIKNWSRDM
jgi:hypothetical protein